MTWVLIPMIGTYVEADHPITVINPTKAFRVHQIRHEQDRCYVRGEHTCWFNVNSLREASQENIEEFNRLENGHGN